MTHPSQYPLRSRGQRLDFTYELIVEELERWSESLKERIEILTHVGVTTHDMAPFSLQKRATPVRRTGTFAISTSHVLGSQQISSGIPLRLHQGQSLWLAMTNPTSSGA